MAVDDDLRKQAAMELSQDCSGKPTNTPSRMSCAEPER
jgi:hypothetical protein